MTDWPDTRDSLLGRLANSADASAWQEFEKWYQPAVYRYARSGGLQENDAWDVVQEVMLAIHRQVGQWQPTGRTGSFRAWLAETTRRQTWQALRLRQRVGQGTGGSELDLQRLAVSSENESTAEAEEHRWLFLRAAAIVEAEVKAIQWKCFWLTAVEQHSATQVAQAQSLSVGAVYSAKCRVLARIRGTIESIRRAEG